MTAAKTCRIAALLVGACFLAVPAMAAEVSRTLVTDPDVLESMGFPRDAQNVYMGAGVGENGGSATKDFGSRDTWITLAPKSFYPRTDTSGSAPYSGGVEGCCTNITRLAGSDTFWDAPLQLPSGVLLKDFRLYAADPDAGADVFMFVFSACHPDGGGATTYTTLASAQTTGTGNQAPIGLVTPNATVTNQTCQYTVRVNMVGNGTQTLQKVRVRFSRQVSPAPATATFNDVPVGDPILRFVEALVAAGITGGCGSSNYCPNDPLTRGQMAVFLSVGLGLSFQ